MQSVDELREQLKSLGYLSHGFERWFALDPWSSRTFWSELLLLALKSATACSPFVAAPFVLITVLKNLPLGAAEITWIGALYLVACFVLIFALVLAGALLFKLRPSLGVESQRFLTAASIALAGVLVILTGVWWSGFRERASLPQLAGGGALTFVAFLVTSTVFAAALLSFSIHETRQIPASRRKSRRGPLAIAGAVLFVALAVAPLVQSDEEPREAPQQIVLGGDRTNVVLIGVDGLTGELFDAREDLRSQLAHRAALAYEPGGSAPQRWASVGTGTRVALHGVRSVDGLRFRGSKRILQSVSDRDPVLRQLAPLLGVAVRQPLPPTARRRDFVWEITAGRAIPSAALNWWTASPIGVPTLAIVPQNEIFTLASRKSPGAIETALRIDSISSERLIELTRTEPPVIAAIYLPALDIVLNRAAADTTAKLAASVTVLDELAALVRNLRETGYEILVIGLPGEEQPGSGVAASTMPLPPRIEWLDIAPSVLDLAGFPASHEMPGTSFAPGSRQARIPSYGDRSGEGSSPNADDEYYRSLRSLGYIQ